MLNHSHEGVHTTDFFDSNRNGFLVKAIKEIKKDEQIMVSYGNKCNSALFQNYGFVIDDNQAN